jgi:hypothetical protein
MSFMIVNILSPINLKRTLAKVTALLIVSATPITNNKAYLVNFHTLERKSDKKDPWFGA